MKQELPARKTMRYPPSKSPEFTLTGMKSIVTEVAFALAARKNDVWRPSGTAVSIGNRVLLTAKHVLADYWSHFEQPIQLRGSLTSRFGIIARQGLRNGEEIAYWIVRRVWLSPATDVAFLLVDPASESAASYTRWRTPPFRLLPPAVGDRVVAFGYHTPSVAVSTTPDGLHVQWDDQATTSVGEVTAIYNERRDVHFLRFPCFETNMRLEGGMSGGPVFNDAGEVCGLVCSSLMGATDPYVSHSVILWPAMATFVHFDTSGRSSEQPMRALELARAGLLNVRGWECLQIVPKDEDSVIICRFP